MSREWRLDSPTPRLRVAQPVGGFKYTSDAFLLAAFALESRLGARTAVDLATGSGIVAYLLAAEGLAVTAVDAEPAWAEGWAVSTGAPVDFRTASVLALPPLPPVDLVTCNPPWWPRGSGPTARDPLVRAGRTEGDASLLDFVDAGLALLAPGGALALVIPAGRGRELDTRPVTATVTVGDRLLVRLGSGPRAPHEVADDARIRAWYLRVDAAPPTALTRAP